MTKRDFGDRLKHIRAFRGLSLREAAELSKVPYPMLSQYENNKAAPGIQNAIKLARAYDVTLDAIFLPESVK